MNLYAPVIEIKSTEALTTTGDYYAAGEKVINVGSASVANIEGDIRAGTNGTINLNDPQSTYRLTGSIIAGQYCDEPYAGVVNVGGTHSTINGDAFASNGGTLNIALNDGQWEGAAKDFTLREPGEVEVGSDHAVTQHGVIDVALNGHAKWSVTDHSQVTSLTMNEGALDLSSVQAPESNAHAFHKVSAAKFEGQNGTLVFNTDLTEGAGGTDQVDISDDATGTHKVHINLSGTTTQKHSATWLFHQGPGSNLTLTGTAGTNQFSARGGTKVWSLGFVPENSESLLTTEDGIRQVADTTTGTEAGDWYLVLNEVAPPLLPSPPSHPNLEFFLPPEVIENVTIGTSSSQAMSWLSEKEDLRQRLGEVRYGAQEGAWVKLDAQKDRFSAGFKQRSEGIHLGYDRLVDRDEDSVWLVGGAFRYADADQEGIALKHIKGDLELVTGKVYGTWIHDNGSYADVVLQVGRYAQKLSGLDNVGTGSSEADYTTYGFGASVEVGHQISLNDDNKPRWVNHWFVEPQLELSYFYAKGADYTTSTGLKVEQGNADFLNGRAGVVIGKKVNDGNDRALDNRYFQFGLKGGIDHEFLGDQTIRFAGSDGGSLLVEANHINGTRLYYGLTADWQINERFRAYADIEREKGDDYTQEYDVSVGLKYVF